MSKSLSDEDVNLLFCYLLELELRKEYTAGMVENNDTVVFGEMQKVFPILDRIGFKHTWLSLLKASNFDGLGFAKYYGSLVYRVGREEFHQSKIPLSEYNSLWSRYSKKGIRGLAFNMKRRQLRLEKGLDLAKDNNVKLFTEHLRAFLACVHQTKLEFNKNLHPAEGDEEIWWATLRAFPTPEQMLPVHTETLIHFSKLLACVLENVFSDRERVRRFANIWTKIPQTMLITSLYFLNPAPFVTKIMGLFLWKPTSNTLSFCQRIASSLVGVSKTVATMDSLRDYISQARITEIEAVIDPQKRKLFSYSPLDEYKSVLNIDDDTSDSLNDVEYAKCIIRLDEKMQYVNLLGESGQSPVLDLLSEYLPILLREMGRIGSMSTMVQLFFNLINKFLEILQKSAVAMVPSQLDTIKELHETFYQFMLDFYPYLQKAGALSNTNGKLVVFPIIVDSILGLFLGWKSQENKSSHLHKTVKDFIFSLSMDDQTIIAKHLEKVVELAESGIDESEWPECSLLNSKVLDMGVEQYLNILKNFE